MGPKLALFGDDDIIIIVKIEESPPWPEERWYFGKAPGFNCLAFIRPGPTIGLNLDKFKKYPFLVIQLPQIFLHEILHWVTRYDLNCTNLIHKIVEKTKGLIL